MGTIAGISFVSWGLLSLPGIAFININSSRRTIYVWTSIPSILYWVLVHLFARESPCWPQRRSYANIKKTWSNKPEFMQTLHFPKKMKPQRPNSAHQSRSYLEGKWALQRSLIVMLTGFGIGIMYCSMPPLAVGNLD
jgi:OCT family organic cation transporter-like MFS transporter 4/5